MWTALGLLTDTVDKTLQRCEKNFSIYLAAFFTLDYTTTNAAPWALIPKPNSTWQDIYYVFVEYTHAFKILLQVVWYR
jgi:hypothetical protein